MQTYLVESGGSIDIRYGVISRFVAPSAAGPWTQIEGLGWQSDVAFSSLNVSQILTQDPLMAGCAAFAAPDAKVVLDVQNGLSQMVLVVTCFINTSRNGAAHLQGRVDALISSDHGSNFDFNQTLLGEEDATRLGLHTPGLSAPQLVAVGSQLYLATSPSLQPPSNISATGGYAGCIVVPLDNSNQSPLHVRRADDGSPVVARYIIVHGNVTAGGCTAWNNIATGYLVPAAPQQNAAAGRAAQGAKAGLLRASFFAP
jgi:hypothetical protein